MDAAVLADLDLPVGEQPERCDAGATLTQLLESGFRRAVVGRWIWERDIGGRDGADSPAEA